MYFSSAYWVFRSLGSLVSFSVVNTVLLILWLRDENDIIPYLSDICNLSLADGDAVPRETKLEPYQLSRWVAIKIRNSMVKWKWKGNGLQSDRDEKLKCISQLILMLKRQGSEDLGVMDLQVWVIEHFGVPVREHRE